MSSHVWRNWARTQQVTPVLSLRPHSVEQVQDAVISARTQKLPVKAIGAGHSFTGIAVAPGVQFDLDGLDGLLAINERHAQATLAAGTNLHQIPALLAPFGLAMANLGDIDRQTIAGAISTGTHGTGARFGGIATQVVALTLVVGDGSLLHISETENAELLPAVRVGLGALGIIVDVTIQCVPAYQLHAVEKPMPVNDVVENFDRLVEDADHFEFHWFPHSELASTKTNTRVGTDVPSHRRSAIGQFIDNRVLVDTVFRALCNVERAFPATIPPVNRISAKLFANGEFTEPSHEVFASHRSVRFREMEYALPREAMIPAFTELRALIDDNGWRIEYPVEVRVAEQDGNWMSTAYGRDTGYIAIHRFFRTDHTAYFTAAEQIFLRYGGRPHWGKLHFRDADYLRTVYPRFDDFLAVRDQLDPERRFRNDYLDRVLGA